MIIDSDGNPLTWTAIYNQYGVRDEEEHDSLEEAVVWLWVGEDQGRLYGVDLRRPDATLLGEDETRRLLDAYDRHGAAGQPGPIEEIGD